MIYILVEYQAKTGCEVAIKKAIGDFVKMIKKNEPGTLRYESFMVNEDGNRFVHVISFSDQQAKKLHENSTYVKHFVLKIDPMCENKPIFKKLNLVDTNVVETEKLVSNLRNSNDRY